MSTPASPSAPSTTARIDEGSETRYSDPLYDSLYAAQREALDPADPGDTTRRRNITDAMQKLLYRDDPSIVLWYEVSLQAYRTDAWTGYGAGPEGRGRPLLGTSFAPPTWRCGRCPRRRRSRRAPRSCPGWWPGCSPPPAPPASCGCAGGGSREVQDDRAHHRDTDRRGCRMTEFAALWPDEAIEAMHLAALGLLERAGVRVESASARISGSPPAARLSARTGSAIPRRAVEEALAACPRAYTLAARDPERALLMDPDPGQTYVHNLGGARDVWQRRAHGRRPPRHAAGSGAGHARHAPPRPPGAGHLALAASNTPTVSSKPAQHRIQERDHDQSAQGVENRELKGLHSHCSRRQKGGNPKAGDETGNQNGLASMVPEELTNPVKAFFGKYLVQAAVSENSVSPFAPDRVHGEIACQNT